jgi:hypothetical protein
VAEELGQARLVLTLDDSALRQGLQNAKKAVEQELGDIAVGTGTRRTTTTRSATAPRGAEDFQNFADIARRFNLRSVIRALEELNTEIQQLQTGRQLNIGTSWGVALDTLSEISADLQRLGAGSQLNLNSSWTSALSALSEIDTDLRQVAAGERLNLNSSWNTALQSLLEIDTDLKQVAAGEKLNLNSSWNTALQSLLEIDTDLKQVAAGERLNLNSSWNAALQSLLEIDTDLKQVAAGEKLNLNSSWNTALQQLQEIDGDLRLVSSAEQLNLRNAWTRALQQLQELDGDLRFIAESKQFNIKSNWQKALSQLDQIALDIQSSDLKNQIAEGLRIGAQNVSPVRGGAGFPGSPIALENAAKAEQKRNQELARARQLLERQVVAEQKLRQQQQKAARERLSGALSNAIIGGAFPLLFGQGIGAAVGGGLGGAGGGLLGGQFGFGLSLVGTALGTAFDTALQKAQTLAQGLDDPIKNFDALREAALLSSKAVERNAEALIAAGRQEEAAALLRADLERTFGSPQAAQEFTNATDELNRAWSQATVSLTKFVAGPLSQFLRGISLFLGGGEYQNAAADVARAREIAASSPQRQADLERLVRQRGGRINEEGNIAGIPSVPVFREFLRLQGELTAEQRQQKELADALSDSYSRTVEFNRLNIDITKANARNNQLEAIALEEQVTKLEEKRKLNALPANAPQAAREAIETETAAKLVGLEEKRLNAQRNINIEIFKEAQTRAQIERGIANSLQLLGAQRGAYRDTLRTIQQISESVTRARQEEAQIGFEIGQARIAGREEEASRLVDKQRTAALQTRAAIIEGARALQEAGESLRDNLRSSIIELTRVRSDPQGLNRFLGPRAQGQRAQEDFRTLLPLFRQAQGQFFQLTGRIAPNLQQTLALSGAGDINSAIRDFIATVDREIQARDQVNTTEQALLTVNKELVTASQQLAEATATLAQKEWTVDVNVVNQAGGASTVNAVTALAS